MLMGFFTLLAGLSVFSVLSWFELPNLDRLAPGWAVAKAETPKENVLLASLCIGGADAPALRAWVSEHPKSKRGRLDHQRLRLQTSD
jgi:hypothetical protein